MTDKPMTRPYRVERLERDSWWGWVGTCGSIESARALYPYATIRIIDRRTGQVIETRDAQ